MEISDLVLSSSASIEGLSICEKHFTHQKEQDENLLYRSHSAHTMTLRRIQNLNGFSIEFFVQSHSAHKVTLRRILQLPTSVGFAQARPN